MYRLYILSKKTRKTNNTHTKKNAKRKRRSLFLYEI